MAGPGGPPAPRASQTKAGGGGLRPPALAFRALRAQPPPPRGPGASAAAKNGRAAGKAGRTGRGPGPHRGAKPLPTAYGQRRRERMAAGGRPGAATALGARISPCAQHRRARSTAVRAARSDLHAHVPGPPDHRAQVAHGLGVPHQMDIAGGGASGAGVIAHGDDHAVAGDLEGLCRVWSLAVTPSGRISWTVVFRYTGAWCRARVSRR